MQTLPLILAVLVPPLVTAIRKAAGEKIPVKYLPLAIPIVGGILAGLAGFLGVDIGAFDAATADASVWGNAITGVLIGAAGVGVHQVKKQLAP